MHRRFDEVRNVVNNLKLHAGRQLRAELFYPALHVVSDTHSVRAGLTHYLYGDNFLPGSILPEQSRPGAQLLGAVLHLCYIANSYWRAAACADDNFTELPRRGYAAQSSETKFLRTCNQAPTRRLDVLALQGTSHVQDCEVVRCEFLCIEQNA